MTTEHDPSRALVAALAKAIQDVGGVAKGGTNEHHGFDYTSADQMVDHCRSALASNGLTVLTSNQTVVAGDGRAIGVELQLKGYKKEVGCSAMLVTEYLLLHSDGGSMPITNEMPIVPDSGRPIDKATLSASTESLSYMLRNLLLIPRGEGVAERDDTSKGNPRAEKVIVDDVTKKWLDKLDACQSHAELKILGETELNNANLKGQRYRAVKAHYEERWRQISNEVGGEEGGE